MVVLPMMLVLVIAGSYVGRLLEQSQHAVEHTVKITELSGQLAEQLRTMERSAQQYLVIGDAGLLQAHQAATTQFLATTAEFLHAATQEAQRTILSKLQVLAHQTHQRLTTSHSDAQVLPAFDQMANGLESIALLNRQAVSRARAAMQHTAKQVQQTLIWAVVLAIPLIVILIVGFTMLITRPIRQIDEAIRRLGDERFTLPVVVSGPEDLRALGDRLEWLRQRLLDVEEEKAKFLRNVSHDLKTPLAAVREGAELLNDATVGTLTPAQQQIAHIIHGNSLQLQGMIEDLLRFNIQQARRSAIVWGTVNLPRIIRDVTERYNTALRVKYLDLAVEMTPISLLGDAAKLTVVFDNLIGNAVKFTPQGGKITVSAQVCGKMVVIRIEDTGPGIAVEESDKIFEPFYSGRPAQEGRVHGTGLGLAIAKEYVLAHEGKIHVTPAAQGNGACFEVSLPLRVGQAEYHRV